MRRHGGRNRLTRWARRHPVLAVITGGVAAYGVFALVVIGFYAVLFAVAPREPGSWRNPH